MAVLADGFVGMKPVWMRRDDQYVGDRKVASVDSEFGSVGGWAKIWLCSYDIPLSHLTLYDV